MVRELTYEERIRWFINNHYETGMEYEGLLVGMKDTNLDSFEWYNEVISIPKYVEVLNPTDEVIKKLSNKIKEFNTPEGENNFNDGVRRGLSLAISIIKNG